MTSDEISFWEKKYLERLRGRLSVHEYEAMGAVIGMEQFRRDHALFMRDLVLKEIVDGKWELKEKNK